MANETPTSGNAAALLPALAEMCMITSYNSDGSVADTLVIDAVINETHEYESDVTDYPTETGSDITDNIRPKPVRVTMDCVVTNTPIGPVVADRDGSNDYVNQAHKFLMALRDNRLPAQISTSLYTYPNMAMKNLTITRGPGGADWLHFVAVWHQVSTVTNKRTQIRTATPSGQPSTTKNKPAGPTPPQGPFLGDPIYIIPAAQSWLDIRIHGWRSGVQTVSQTQDIQANGVDLGTGFAWQINNYLPDTSLYERVRIAQDILQLNVFQKGSRITGLLPNQPIASPSQPSDLDSTATYYARPSIGSTLDLTTQGPIWAFCSSAQQRSFEDYITGLRRNSNAAPYASIHTQQFKYNMITVPRKYVAYIGT